MADFTYKPRELDKDFILQFEEKEMSNNLSEYIVKKLYDLNIIVASYKEIDHGNNYSLLGGYTLTIYNTGKYVYSHNLPKSIITQLSDLELGKGL